MSTQQTAKGIPAKLVKELRERTGAGFSDCRAALVEANGNIEKAIDILRKKGQAAAACPFFRRISMAFSMTPFASTGAARQSAKPALVLSRNSFTSCAGICTAGCCVLILFSLC